MRILPPPDSAILLPPSITIFAPALLATFAVAVSTIVVGSAPQLNVITPPLATAATTASPVQLAGVPVPTTVVGLDTSSACASAGTAHVPSGLPAAGPLSTAVGGPASPCAPAPPSTPP